MSAHARQQQPSASLSEDRHPAVAPTANTVPVVAVSTAPSSSDSQQLEIKNRLPLNAYLNPQISSYFIAGGVAGAASRTVVSPLERLKIIQQVQPESPDKAYKGVWRSLVRMWHEEGFKGFMRGNGINCLRIVPYSAVQFTTYEQLKKWFTSYGAKELDTPTRLLAGALAGITSVCSTYPLDLVRSRLSIATATMALPEASTSSAVNPSPSTSPGSNTQTSGIINSQPVRTFASVSATASASAYQSSSSHVQSSTLFKRKTPPHLTILGMARKVMAEEGGVRALYRGLPATAFGVAPYVGINFASYEALRGWITPPGTKPTALRKLLCGALAGSISQTLTYPMDVLRRKMQVTGMKSLGVHHTGAVDALRYVIRNEGLKGLYKGIWPNLLKVAPSIATSFYTYELVKDFLLS
ncbi:hypothetical protein ACEPAH_6601 [Sanghuangporus vaninii]